jgi:hypothetical protein
MVWPRGAELVKHTHTKPYITTIRKFCK